MSLRIPFLLTKENYLAINSEEFLKIDPASVDDIAGKVNLLSDDYTYKTFTQQLAQLKFDYSWDAAANDHLELFKKLI